MPFLNSLFGNKPHKKTDINSAIDLVTYAAGLASDQTSFDPALDTVRSITSMLEAGQTPSAEDEKKLLNVYLQIEQYLTTSDPVRKFAKDDLRAHLNTELRQQLENFEATHKKGG